MKTSLQKSFNIDRDNSKVIVEHEFSAPLQTIWDAWTNSDILDKWWAPKPWQARTKEMDFREGGYWLYAMVGPDGAESWARADYQSVTPLRGFIGHDAFTDEQGNINTDFPQSSWNVGFTETLNGTLVNIEIDFEQQTDLDRYLQMGFQEGFTAGLQNLDDLLSSKHSS